MNIYSDYESSSIFMMGSCYSIVSFLCSILSNCVFLSFFFWPLNVCSLNYSFWSLSLVSSNIPMFVTFIYYRHLQDAYRCVGTKLDSCSHGVHLLRDVILSGSRYICNENSGGKIMYSKYAHYFVLYLFHSKLRILILM